jgi:hypothetical protein
VAAAMVVHRRAFSVVSGPERAVRR